MLRWMDAKVMVQRAPTHENYTYHVWYNVRLIDMLGMSKNDVDMLTQAVREGQAVIPDSLKHYMTRVCTTVYGSPHLRVRVHKGKSNGKG